MTPYLDDPRARLVHQTPRTPRTPEVVPPLPGPVVYWMHRDHRARDNFGLLKAMRLGRARGEPVAVIWCLAPEYLDATIRQYGFLLRGMRETAQALGGLGVAFFLRVGSPAREVAAFCRKCGAGALVTDFDPLRVKRAWVREAAQESGLPVIEVDSRNIVPCHHASGKYEVAARTLRPKLHRLLPDFLQPFPAYPQGLKPWPEPVPEPDWDQTLRGVRVDRSVAEVDWAEPGERAGAEALERFVAERLPEYAALRNDPTRPVQSGLSPWLHFGQISALAVALAVQDAASGTESARVFLEELIVRRELSDNFCLHQPAYDTPASFPDWARRTLAEHASDPREAFYEPDDLEAARTHDELWNAAQRGLVAQGRMHGYLRMYWGKKILEWSPDPAQALAVAVRLNDRYALDGRDTNGYAGMAWCIGGVHDRPWPARPVFGNVRSMSFQGAARKFDVRAYIESMRGVGR